MTRASRCLAALALMATALSGQENIMSMDGGAAWKGFSIRFIPKIDPGGATVPSDLSGAVIDPGVTGVAQRFIYDEKNKRTFGYDLYLDPSADGATAQLRITPLHDPNWAVRNGWGMWGLPLGLPKYPVIPGLRLGDTVALDLLVNPSTGQKLADYLTLIRAGASLSPPHDFSLQDVWLSLDTPRILADGKPLAPGNANSHVSGRTLLIDIDGHGRFLFSLFPHDKLGFRRNGTAESNTLTFEADGIAFRVECAGPIAPGPGPYNLFVLRQTNPGPRAAGQFGVSSAGDPEGIVTR